MTTRLLLLVSFCLIGCDKLAPGDDCVSTSTDCETRCVDFEVECPSGADITPGVCSDGTCSTDADCATDWVCGSGHCIPEELCPRSDDVTGDLDKPWIVDDGTSAPE